MSTNTSTPLATVADITGKVWAVAGDGTRHILEVGDAVYEGEVILTETGSTVVLRNANGADLKVTEGKEVALADGLFDGGENTFTLDLRGLIAATDGVPDAPAASAVPLTLSPGNATGPQTLHGFLNVERINESVTTPVYEYWSFTGRYNPETQLRSANFDPFFEGRATVDERIALPLEPMATAYVEPLPEQLPIVLGEAQPLQPTFVPSVIVPVTGAVQEDALPGGNSLGEGDKTVKASGPVASLVSSGPLPISFSLQVPGPSVVTSEGFPVTSQGEPVLYRLVGGVLEGYVPGSPDRSVFTLKLDGSNYTFILRDQVDHPDGSGDNAVLTLDLSSALVATDSGGTPVTVKGSFTITVENDVPTLNLSGGNAPAAVTAMVYEDALGHENDTLDRSTGNLEGLGQVAQVSGYGSSGTGHPLSLSTLISSGADEPVTFSLVTSAGALTSALGTLYSNGDTLSYTVSGDTLSATAGSGSGSRTVFTLTVSSDGQWNFNLNDQLDHLDNSSAPSKCLARNF